MKILRSNRIWVLRPEQIQASSRLLPCGRPNNILPVLSHDCAEDQWGVRLDIRVDELVDIARS
jgi:hypothetical protein